MGALSVPRITCSSLDADWYIKLPSILNDEDGTAQVSLLSTSVPDIVTFREKDNTIFLATENRDKILQGKLCPEPSVQMIFEISSKTHGEVKKETIVIPVVKNSEELSSEKYQLQPLRVETTKIKANGKLTIKFNN